MNWIHFIYKNKSSGASISNPEHLLAELQRIYLKLRRRLMQVSFAQSLLTLIGVAIADTAYIYNERIAAGK
jgi:hypothetical protein